MSSKINYIGEILEMHKANILVTGGAGYIGSNTVDALIKSGFKVVIVDDLSSGFQELIHPEAFFYQVNILDTDQLTQIMITQEIHAVIHFAAKIVVPESVTNSLLYYTNNTYGVISTLKACKNAGVKNFVFSSTAAIYGENNLEVLSETTPVSPSNPYAFSKLFSEQIVRDAENDFGCKSIVFRYFNVAGASDNLKFGQITTSATHLIKIVSQAAVGKRDKVYITGTDYPTHDGTGIRDYIHVTDLAHAHVLGLNYLLSGGESDLFNIGYGNGSSVREVIACMKKVTNIDFPVIETDRRLGDVQRLVANPNKIVKILNWHPRFQNLEKICESAYLFEKKLTSANLDF